MGAQGCSGPAGEASVSSLEAAEVCTVCVWVRPCVGVYAGHPVCSLLAVGETLLLLVHFKLILLMLSNFILLSLIVNLSFCLVHLICDSYPVNSQSLTCPHCQPKLPLEKELAAASQRMLWRPKEHFSSEKGLSTDSAKRKACPSPVSQLSPLRDATRHCVSLMPSLN